MVVSCGIILLLLNFITPTTAQDIPGSDDPCYGFISGWTPDPPPYLQLNHSIQCEDGGVRYDIATSPLGVLLWYERGNVPFRLCFKGADMFTEIYLRNQEGDLVSVEYPPVYTENPDDAYCHDSFGDIMNLVIIPPPSTRYIAMTWWKSYSLDKK